MRDVETEDVWGSRTQKHFLQISRCDDGQAMCCKAAVRDQKVALNFRRKWEGNIISLALCKDDYTHKRAFHISSSCFVPGILGTLDNLSESSLLSLEVTLAHFTHNGICLK